VLRGQDRGCQATTAPTVDGGDTTTGGDGVTVSRATEE
jgi:hypothetical protein